MKTISEILSMDLESTEALIDDSLNEIMSHKLEIAIAVYHMIRDDIFRPLYTSAVAYFNSKEKHWNLTRQEIFRFYHCGKGYVMNSTRLLEKGFSVNGHYSKLEYLEKAIEQLGEEKAFEAFFSLPFKGFQSLATTDPKKEQPEVAKVPFTPVEEPMTTTWDDDDYDEEEEEDDEVEEKPLTRSDFTFQVMPSLDEVHVKLEFQKKEHTAQILAVLRRIGGIIT